MDLRLITIPDLIKSETLLEVACQGCQRHEYIEAGSFPTIIEQFGPMNTFAEVADKVPCWFCKKPGIKVFEIDVRR